MPRYVECPACPHAAHPGSICSVPLADGKQCLCKGELAKPENPQAFRSDYYRDPGMTLRDYFAAAALTGLLASDKSLYQAPHTLTTSSYNFADAMLSERERA